MRNACDEIVGHRNRPACSAAKEKGMRPRDEWPKEGMGLRAMCGMPGAEEFNTRLKCSSLSNKTSSELRRDAHRDCRISINGISPVQQYATDKSPPRTQRKQFNTCFIRQRTTNRASIELFRAFRPLLEPIAFFREAEARGAHGADGARDVHGDAVARGSLILAGMLARMGSLVHTDC